MRKTLILSGLSALLLISGCAYTLEDAKALNTPEAYIRFIQSTRGKSGDQQAYALARLKEFIVSSGVKNIEVCFVDFYDPVIYHPAGGRYEERYAHERGASAYAEHMKDIVIQLLERKGYAARPGNPFNITYVEFFTFSGSARMQLSWSGIFKDEIIKFSDFDFRDTIGQNAAWHFLKSIERNDLDAVLLIQIRTMGLLDASDKAGIKIGTEIGWGFNLVDLKARRRLFAGEGYFSRKRREISRTGGPYGLITIKYAMTESEKDFYRRAVEEVLSKIPPIGPP